MTEEVPVVVVGAGPTGVTAALLLAGLGIRVLVLERWPGPYGRPRAVHVDDEVFRILARIGVAEGFAGISRPGLGLRLVGRDQRVLAEFRRSPHAGRHGFPQANMFDQPDLERLLRDELAASSGVELRGGSRVTAVRQERDHVEVEYLDDDKHRSVRARYVLGADGANSLVRGQIGSVMRDLGFEQRWLVLDVDADVDLGHWEGVHQVGDPVRAATYMRVTGTRHRWEFRMLPGESLAERSSLSSVRQLIRPWVEGVPDEQLHLVRAAEYTFRAQVADHWRDRRVFLLGDAAHRTPPFIGQGLGAGLRDAANLSWKLAGVLDGRLPERHLETYQAERKPHATAMIRRAVLLGVAMTGGGRPGDLARRVIAPRLPRLPVVRRMATDSTTPRLSRSALARRSLLHPFLGGALCPNLELADGGRLDDVRAAFVVVSLVEVPTREVEARGGRVVLVRPDAELGRWLRRHRARLAVVRPDGTVLVAGRRPGPVLAAVPGGARPARSRA